MIITLKDGSKKEYSEAKSVIDIAYDISEGLARAACAGEVNGEVVDLRTVLDKDCELNILTAKDEKGKQIALKLLQELAKSYKVYFVNGEHDCDEKFIQNLKDNEVNVLDYKKETIAIKNTKINLYGITNQYYSATFDLKNAFEINKEEYNILLAHISNFEEFEQFGIDLSLCGDTHGGQVRLPFLGAIINRGIWFPEIVQKGLNVETNYIKGLYSINNSYLYVSSGLGNYPISIRLFNRPEIAVIKLR